MAVSLRDLRDDRKELKLVVGDEGDVLTVVYRPSGFTLAAEEAYQDELRGNKPGKAVAEILADIVIDWDLVEPVPVAEDGGDFAAEYGGSSDEGELVEKDGEFYRKVPLMVEGMGSVPRSFLFDLFGVLSEDSRTEREDRKNSGGGLRRKET